MDPGADQPERVRRMRAAVPDDEKLLAIFTDVLDCFLRHLSATPAQHRRAGPGRFLAHRRRVRHRVRRHGAAPGRADAAARLFAPEFPPSCLNRPQLRNNRQMVDPTDGLSICK
ncbi:IucA/IucC family C-terminal-domain containing protein [Micromonospora sp. NPDC051141]|uniref:IucA/IucC family C-terminal-domain containing protein n=1 Tax=Micromonospora sp. NPDC051141 TaxID=3364284 RepID=UPI0037BA8575